MAINIDVSPRSDAERLRKDVASRIAAELRNSPSEFKLAKVTSLLHAFRAPGVHTDIAELLSALREQGIAADSGWPDTPRRSVLALQLKDDKQSQGTSPPGVRLSLWGPGRAGREERLVAMGEDIQSHGADDLLWFDVDPPADASSPTEVHSRVDEVTALLAPWCPGLDEFIVRDLLTADVQPKVETHGDERTGTRSVSVAAVIARETKDDDDDFDQVDEQLIFQMVEVVTGKGWLLTCWHPSRTFGDTGEGRIGSSILREPILSHVAHRWVHDEIPGRDPGTPKSSVDLGLYLARSLVATYGASMRLLQRWVSSWEAGFYKSLNHEDKPKKLKEATREISNFLAMVGDFHRVVSAFRLAGEEMPNKSWFTEVRHRLDRGSREKATGDHSEALASAVETAERKLTQLSADIRADMDLLMIHSQATQQESSERLQAYLGKVTGLVLVPTFVAGLFGANTALPGGGSWTGFDIMLVLMVLSAAVSYLAIRKLIT